MEEKETTTKSVDEFVSETNQEKRSPTTPTSSSNAGSWWGGWISQAKEKSASVLEAVRNDLNEITTAVTETLHLVPNEEELIEEQQQQDDQTSGVSFNHMKQSISSSISTFFGTVTDALIPQLDEDDTSEAILISNDDTIVLSGFTKHLKELQENDETYLEEPSKTAELAEKYRMWLEIVEQEQFTKPSVEKMLQQSQVLNEKYNKFVPDTVSHMNFFKRYLFKKALLEDELANEERKRKEEAIVKTQPEPTAAVVPVAANIIEAPIVENKTSQVIMKKNEEISGGGDLDISNYELSEEEQARLLEAYEQEIKEREKKGEVFVEEPPMSKAQTKSQKSNKKSSNVQSKTTAAAAAAATTTTKGKNNKDLKNQPHPTQKSTQQQKGSKSQAKQAGKQQTKECESSTSDESWEKDFDM